MKKQTPLDGLVIIAAVVRNLETGYILAVDPKKEEEDEENVPGVVVRWKNGEFWRIDREFNPKSTCIITVPESARVELSSEGWYTVDTPHRAGKPLIVNDVINEDQPKREHDDKFYIGFHEVTQIAGRAYAIGLRGRVYRLDSLDKWTRIDEGLPYEFDIHGIHGFNESDIYAVGRKGMCWHYDGKNWTKCTLPTIENLNTVVCGDDKTIYIGGQESTLIYGNGKDWKKISKEHTPEKLENIWDLEWFNNKLYISSFEGLFEFNQKEGIVGAVDFGKDKPNSTYQLTIAPGVLWSVGEHDIMRFDGKTWTRIV